ncbi:heavy-metal-associated domain-containing protein [Ciceribacter thiooxidans]|uniref:Heavy-metal-associated domain-containing protein n=1 Tax=Ciceribacter thiooxidans TaxID=1969821 RepID=A0ABV7HY84_9HYPH|nr:heavy-metal-associated domain-containing protein [Ciceribacter thiooxidans]
MTERNLFRVEDMTCGHCAKSVKTALADALPGAEVSVDLVSHEVRVAGDAAKAEAAIREAGYTPERIGA